MKYGFFRCASARPEILPADTDFNSQKIIEEVQKASEQKINLLVFPELSITGCTCGDLFLQQKLLEQSLIALEKIAEQTKALEILFTVGLPVKAANELFDCNAFVYKGEILALIPKINFLNTSCTDLKRYFSDNFIYSFDEITLSEKLVSIPFGPNIILEDKSDSMLKIACEISEDLYAPLSPSLKHVLAGATIICNSGAIPYSYQTESSDEQIIKTLSRKLNCAYIYSNACKGESSTDEIFSGSQIIAENGILPVDKSFFTDQTDSDLLICDIDLEILESERLRNPFISTSKKYFSPEVLLSYRHIPIEFSDNSFANGKEKKSIGFESTQSKKTSTGVIKLFRKLNGSPFIPEACSLSEKLSELTDCLSQALAKRLTAILSKNAVIGLSGGLDSTLALLTTVKAFDKCSLDRKNILCVTMPCFGTTDRTYNNACTLSKATGTSLKEINIKKSVLQHFEDIGHDEKLHDVTYENSQARERTQILMDLANSNNALVIGTGDLSELALGWCTYNGDHMSMYGVNGSIPKTLVRYLVDFYAAHTDSEELSAVLKDILDTPVSPELLPPDGSKIAQKTEDIVGPYELHDFFMYYILRYGFTPEKIYFLTVHAFEGKQSKWGDYVYTKEIILKWLKNFYRRFFTQQFKRSCMPEGAGAGSIGLSPRGSWKMPGDASSAVWLKEIEALVK